MKKLLLSLLCLLLLLCACAPAAPVITAEPTPIPIEENAPAPTPKATPIVVADGKAADVLVVSTGSRYGLADSAGKLIAAPIYSNIRKISGERLILTIENADGLPLHALALQTGERLTDHIYAEIVELGNGMGRAKCRETGETHIIGLDTGLVLAALPAHIDLAGICPANATMLAVDTEKGCAVCYSLADALRGEFTALARYDEKEVDHCCRYWPETGLGAFCLDEGMLLFGAGSEPFVADSIDPANDSEYIRFTESGKNGYCDLTGSVVIPRSFRESGSFANGLAPAKDGELYGYIDATGAFALAPAYAACGEFFGGYARVTFSDGTNAVIDTTGAIVLQPVNRMLTHTAEDGTKTVLAVGENGTTLLQGETIAQYLDLTDITGLLFLDCGVCALRQQTPEADQFLLFDLNEGKVLLTISGYTGVQLIPAAINTARSSGIAAIRTDGLADIYAFDGTSVLRGANAVLGGGESGYSVIFDGEFGIVNAAGRWLCRLGIASPFSP